MKIIIIGASHAGAVAFGSLRSYSPKVFDMASGPRSTGAGKHKAVMRIRSPEAGILMGVNLRKIKVRKAVLYQGQLHNHTNITHNNLYSLKAYGIIEERSINNLDWADRYLVEGQPNFGDNVNYGYQFRQISGKEVMFTNKENLIIENFDYIISTMPMPDLLKILGLDYKIDFIWSPIHTLQINLDLQSSVNQTIYVPESAYSTYRVTLQEDSLKFEAVEAIDDEEVSEISSYFGIKPNQLKERKAGIQKMGKILPIPDDVRRAIIVRLSRDYNIFSLGRYAVWKPIRIDHFVKDMEVIKSLITTSESRRQYELQKI